MNLIPLTKGQYALVDEIDFKALIQFKWQATFNPGMGSYYATRSTRVGGKTQTLIMHRVILGLAPGDLREGDHVESGQTLDNRRSNLRIATRQQNVWNGRKRRKGTAPYKGISRHGNGWRAQIRKNGVQIHLGMRSTPEAAHALYCAAALELHGEFARAA